MPEIYMLFWGGFKEGPAHPEVLTPLFDHQGDTRLPPELFALLRVLFALTQRQER